MLLFAPTHFIQVELISKEDQLNVFIKYPIEIEQNMMEGSYNKVLKARETVPSETYMLFAETLLGTVRDEIAESTEEAYLALTVEEAKKLLGLPETPQLEEYAKKVNFVVYKLLIFWGKSVVGQFKTAQSSLKKMTVTRTPTFLH